MFDSLVAATAGVSGADALRAWARVENAGCARRVAAMAAMLDAAYAVSGSASRDQWCIDNVDAVAAHVGATQGLTPGTAANQLIIAVALHERFPTVAAVFADGLIGYPLVRTIVTRAAMVTDPDTLRALDTALAETLRSWEPMSADRTEKTIDAIIAQLDPDAVVRTETRARGRCVDVNVDDGSGIGEVFASLFAPDAHAVDTRLTAMAATVCPADPRTTDQRRADALGALGRGQDRLICLCGTPGCPAADLPPSTGVVVHVIAHDDTLTRPDTPAESAAPADASPRTPAAAECAALDGDQPPLHTRPVRDLTLTQALTPTPGQLATIRPAATMGGHLIPGAIARRVATGATLRPIRHPGLAPPEPRYRPSRALADFIRCRDLTCRFPGCSVPATHCDLDHTIAWPHGPTAASNLKALCRRHHLLKTFWGGQHGWRDRQEADGTIVWTTPEGRDHITTPGSRRLFPELSRPTAPTTATAPPTAHTAGLTMPRRRTTRAHDRARRITRQRELNAAAAAIPAATPPQDPLDTQPDTEPPPF